jgi:hypothetical protein
MTTLLIVRKSYSAKQVIGLAEIRNGGVFQYTFNTLEPPWKRNANKISCIPAGKYKAVKRASPKYGHHWHIQDVQGRSLILIHSGNRYTHTLGCILVGSGFADIDKDGIIDVTGSVAVMNRLRSILPDEFEVEIID